RLACSCARHLPEPDRRLSRTEGPVLALVAGTVDVPQLFPQAPVLRADSGASMICALLLGREGSSGFPGKNVYPVLGRPLVAYPLLAAAGARSVDRVYLSTDSPA